MTDDVPIGGTSVQPAPFEGFLVNTLRDEHRDREWVDAYGNHWAWMEDTWVWHLSPEQVRCYPPGMGYEEWHKPADPAVVNQPRQGYDYGPGPFMEAMHHRLLWERR
jgi:hypothetical protein